MKTFQGFLRHKQKITAVLQMLAAAALLQGGQTHAVMEAMDDTDLSVVEGQAFFQTDKLVGTGSIATGTTGITFYKVGLDAQLDLNMNIKELELGRTSTGVDIWGRDVAFGCTATTGTPGTCVSETGAGTATQLRPFILKRPYLQFAIANDQTAASREIVGIRLGAENVSGPLSFGQLLSFSGYLNATANFTMQGQNNMAATCGPNAGPTYCKGTGNHATGVNYMNYNAPDQSLGLNNFEACGGVWPIILCDEARNLLVGYGSASQNGAKVTASGSRLTQALINDVNLDALVNEIIYAGADGVAMSVDASNGVSETLLDIFIGQIRPQAETNIKNQLSTGLKIGVAGELPGCAALTSCDIPYNLGNMHQVTVNSSNFGLSFQKQALAYPGYTNVNATPTSQTVPVGWAMYLPNAFTLNVVRPASQFTYRILQGDAYNGNIISLPPVYDNCWGPATFC
jgi:hypothetical protein